MPKYVELFTDGACKGNPGVGGWGALMRFGETEKRLFGAEAETTNNRMELMAVIAALEALKNSGTEVIVYSDSKYVVDSVEKKWVFGWQKKGFKGKKNIDLWKRFLLVYPKHNVKFVWVKGHAGNFYNERCDELAVQAAEGGGLLPDVGYENA